MKFEEEKTWRHADSLLFYFVFTEKKKRHENANNCSVHFRNFWVVDLLHWHCHIISTCLKAAVFVHNSKERNYSCAINTGSDGEAISCLLRKLTILYGVDKRQPFIRRQIPMTVFIDATANHTQTSHSAKPSFNNILPSKPRSFKLSLLLRPFN